MLPNPKEKQSSRIKLLGRFDLQPGKCGQSQGIVTKVMRTQELGRGKQRTREGKGGDRRGGGD